jgi:eukaryotic-like serine/threonine-protein kinase
MAPTGFSPWRSKNRSKCRSVAGAQYREQLLLAGPTRVRQNNFAMNFSERIQWLGRLALMLFILASAAFLSAITAMRFAVQGREVVMPDVSGKKVAEAQAALQARGLGIRVEDRIYSSRPVDAVVRQSPPAGMRVKVGQWAHVVLSLGPQEATIPNLAMKSVRADRIELMRSGLELGEISNGYFPDIPPDTAFMQEPPPGTKDAQSSRVDVLVSLGARPDAYVMPDLQGIQLAEAQARLSASGLKVAELNLVPFNNIASGVVAGQTPAPGARVDSQAQIELQVAE